MTERSPAQPTPPEASSPRVLIVEDQERVAKALAILLELDGIDSVIARSPEAALACLDGGRFDLALQDMNFTPGATSGAEGIALFRRLRAERPELPLVLLTAWGQIEAAVELVRSGASDYIEKPWDEAKLLASVRAILSSRAGRRSAPVESNERYAHEGEAACVTRRELAARYDLCGVVYASAAMHDIVALAARVAASEVPVLVTGESGTGKEKLAEILHANSPRRGRPFVRVDAGALPEALLEAELFGAEAGAFTGSQRRRIGRFEAADGGTLLLDEIGNLPLSGQAKLLRVLQSGRFERLGSSQSVEVDVRVVAATNLDLSKAIAAGTFREDLYYRLAVIEIEVPPLGRRLADVVPLAEHFLAEFGGGEGAASLSAESRRALASYAWPGNVRELRNRVQRAVLLARGSSITPDDLGLSGAPEERLPRGPAPLAASAPRAGASESTPPPSLGDGAEAEERRQIETLLVDCGGVVSQAAARLGLSRQALYRRMERLGIVLERRPRG